MNAVSPGVIPTPSTEHLGVGFVDSQVSAIPLLRVGTPDEIAKAIPIDRY
ncbi:hypothetical protein [Scytonema sp. NUACC26]